MSRQYGCIAFTDDVRGVQADYGSSGFYDRMSRRADGSEQLDPLGPQEKAFLTERDGFYLSTVGETGWPYVQFRGGPPGFLQVRDDNTIAWADFRGNLQHVSTGNLVGDRRVAMIAVDYPRRRRLKLFGMARVIRVEDDPALVSAVAVPGYDAVVEAAIVVTVTAFDWNCPQHIPRRFTLDEVEQRVAPLRARIRELEDRLAAVGG
ncbi:MULTISPECIES: pyridoxamine 5'-phosphate oxidase family protein [unclassified Leifsonia]|uniref:pyridoxamine 5'-phosphate oxidase family protein n=1 Tax=unclassified Leifsonia TaxID=2663824 RepID=UPI0006FD6FD7|nr:MULTISPECIES: pyridoxamine 5'-phosphate oxidase family protein [unclassified Leifsonia]KQX06901.1 pyridoxamine 5-phosphate oxidase [Leifsonia sp. Root1293]KRA11186.1 pyridoxamine 5-phosphate oxidase [Leifsonia sp. Root60]